MNPWRCLRSIAPAILLLLSLAPAPHAAAPAAAKGAPLRRARPTAARVSVACLSDALGGMELLARFRSLYTRYRIEIGGLEGTDVFWHDAGGGQRESLDVTGAFSELVVFDGTRGWRRGP